MGSRGSRTVTLALCLRDGRMLGSLAPFDLDDPWWQEVGPIVRGARERFGVEVTVLRLLSGEAGGPPGGRVAYLASVEAEPAVPLAPWQGDAIVEEPLRVDYAKPGGPELDLAWADEVLQRRGTPRVGPAEQVRTWNLSSLWRLPLAGDAAWLKVIPPFFAHEGAMLARLGRDVVPPLIAAEGLRVLMAEVEGEDQYDAPLPRLQEMVRLLVNVQLGVSRRPETLAGLTLPDWRASSFTALAQDVIERTGIELDVPARGSLESLLDRLPERFEALADCGIPDSLVHGDFHPGNFRGNDRRIALLDWGDCGFGHPLFDQTAFFDRIDPALRPAMRAVWSSMWRTAIAGSEPDQARALIAPLAALRQAIVYRAFLDGIEPNERVYHAKDPADWLARAAALHRTPPPD